MCLWLHHCSNKLYCFICTGLYNLCRLVAGELVSTLNVPILFLVSSANFVGLVKLNLVCLKK